MLLFSASPWGNFYPPPQVRRMIVDFCWNEPWHGVINIWAPSSRWRNQGVGVGGGCGLDHTGVGEEWGVFLLRSHGFQPPTVCKCSLWELPWIVLSCWDPDFQLFASVALGVDLKGEWKGSLGRLLWWVQVVLLSASPVSGPDCVVVLCTFLCQYLWL